MSEWMDAHWMEPAALNDVLRVGRRWDHGRAVPIGAQRIGTDFGFSGRVYRLRLDEASGGPASIVAKFEDAAGIGRAVAFRDENDALLTGLIPVAYGSRIDRAADRGMILLEDVDPATQGDDVKGCTEAQAGTIIGLVARLHANTWRAGADRSPDPTPEWAQRDWAPERWSDRLTRAASRFPDRFDAEMSARLSEFPTEAADAFDRLQRGSRAWVHRDPHPDNALWRPDGRLVMLDWSNSTIAPPAIDVAVLLSTLSFRTSAPLSADAVLTDYRTGLADNGLEVDENEIRRDARAGVRLSLRGAIGWAGSTAVPSGSARVLELRARSVDRVRSALRWLDTPPR